MAATLQSRRLSLVVATALVVLLLSGCYPRPHDFVLTQEFSGVLVKAGAPMPGVTVTVSHTRGDTGDYCVDPEVVAVTSDTGTFRVPPRMEKRHFTSILNPPRRVAQSMSICFQALGKRKLGAFVISPTDHLAHYEALCDWDSRGVEFKQNTVLAPYQWGICTRREPTAGH